jgi:hypothetical protein
MAIPFLPNYGIKPVSISVIGDVTFTDGTNNIVPNQQQCEAYGYTYNKVTGTCSTFTFSTNLGRNLINESNKLLGAGNTTETGTNNTQIIGEDNTVKGTATNNILVGNGNEVANGVNNGSVFGTKGEVTANNSLVIGGNSSTDNLGERQSMQLMYGVQTTTGSTVNSFLNNITDKFLVVPDNTIMYFHADVIAVRVGGTAEGSNGDYASWVERGVVINESGTLSVNRERDTIKTNGSVSAWRPVANVTGTNFRMTVRGATDVTIEWNSNITFTQIKTGVAL